MESQSRVGGLGKRLVPLLVSPDSVLFRCVAYAAVQTAGGFHAYDAPLRFLQVEDRVTDPQLAFLFPGQGSQSLGMLAELAELHSQVRETFAEASEGAGEDLWALSQAGPEEQLNRTEFTQPALLAAGVAVWRLWSSQGGVQPALLAGHSLGEYTALVAAGALSLHDGARLVRLRGQLMQEAAPAGVGAMAAVLGAEDALVLDVCAQAAGSQVVVPANFNSPGQIVIGGDAEAVDRALALLAERGVRKAVKLAVSVPSHTPLDARSCQIVWPKPWPTCSGRRRGCPSCRTWMPRCTTVSMPSAQALVQQLYLPVQWTGCVQALAARSVTRVAECGPGKVLTGLVKRIDKGIEGRSLATPADFAGALEEWAR